MSDLISIIVPVYNVEKYLPRCLDSLAAQTYENVEIILINDASADGSLAVCNAYAQKDKRIKVIDCAQNGGVCAARNKGLEAARGAYIGFVDADDWVSPDMYRRLYDMLKSGCAQAAACGVYFVNNGKAEEAFKTKEGLFTPQDFLLLNYNYLYCANKLFDRNILKDVSFKTELCVSEDAVFCAEVLQKAKFIAVTNTACYYYDRRAQSATRGGFCPSRMTYFTAADCILRCARDKNMSALISKIEAERAYHAAGFLRQIAACGCDDEKITAQLVKEVRQNIFKHLKSRHKLSNKLFALCCCINFKLAKNLYNFLGDKNV